MKLRLNFALHPAQKIIDDALKTHRFVYVIAGRKFGKTAYAIRKAIIEAWNSDRPVWYLAPFHTQAFEIAWMTFLETIPKEILVKSREDKKYIQLKNGNTIWIKGVQHESILRGAELSFAVLDEFVNMSYYIWESVLAPMFIRTKGKALFIGTVPDPRREYVSKEFVEDYKKYLLSPTEDCISFHFTSFDNPYLHPEEIEKAIRRAEEKGKRDWAEREYLGKYELDFGTMFELKTEHIIEPFEIPQDWMRVMAIDPHPNTPFASLWVAINPQGEYFVYRELQQEHSTLREFVETIKRIENESRERIKFRLIDPTFATVEQTAIGVPSVKKMLMEYGLYTQDANRNFDSFYYKMRELLAQNKIFFFKSCPITIFQVANMEWDTYSSRKRIEEGEVKHTPRRMNYHFFDCLKYIVNANVSYISDDEIERIKELIARRRELAK